MWTRVQRSRSTRMTMTHDFSPLALACREGSGGSISRGARPAYADRSLRAVLLDRGSAALLPHQFRTSLAGRRRYSSPKAAATPLAR